MTHARTAVGAAIAALAINSAAAAQPAASAIGPQPGVVLLRNGQALEGRILRAGEHYHVSLADAEIHLNAKDVERVCASLEEGYRAKRDELRPNDCDGRLRLANWCIRHNLLGNAAQEIAAAIAIDPSHERIGAAERQLAAARRPPPAPLAPSGESSRGPQLEDLNRMALSLPPGAIESFAAKVQPLLMNRCAAGGCHGPNADCELRLLRARPGMPQSRRATLRNLHGALACIDVERPDASPLLAVPSGPHGGLDAPVFTELERADYDALAAWVAAVVERREPQAPATVSLEAEGLLARMRAEFADDATAIGETAATPGMPSERVAQTALAQPTEGTLDAAPSDDDIDRLVFPEREHRRPVKRPFTPRDEFDPEIFNRRYHGAAAGEATP